MLSAKVAGGQLIAGVLLLLGMAVMAGCDLEQSAGPADGTGGTTTLTVSKSNLEFLVDQDSNTSNSTLFQLLELNSNDGSLVNWAIITDQSWITISTTEGETSSEFDEVGVSIIMDQLTPGLHTGSITIIEENAGFQKVTVTVRVCEGPCVYVNPTNLSHKVTSLMFGSQSEYVNSGTGIWDSIATNDCNDPAIPVGGPNLEQLNEYSQLGIGVLRYPSGTPSDFFHWNEAIGPIDSRIPQINPWDSSFGDLKKECPVFGPDEFAQYAELLNASILITTNAANGTDQEAAGWLSYYEGKGIEAKYWEVGNEIYIDGTEYLFAASYLSPTEYATTFDAHAVALRQVNPDVKVGAVMSPMEQDWNRGVMAAITEPFDFISLHSWQPQIDTCGQPSDEVVYQSLLASPLLMEVQLKLISETAKDLAALANKTPTYLISEWGPWFLPCTSGALNNAARARTMASALFSGLVWNSMMRDPNIFSATHSTLLGLDAQSSLNIVLENGIWVPIRSAHYFVQKLYAESAGGMIIPTQTRNSPTFSAKLFDDSIEPVEQPVLDSIAVLSEDESKLYVYIVNRSLTEDIDFELLTGDLPGTLSSVVADSVVANSYSDLNTAVQPDAVGVVNTVLATNKELSLTIQAHTLVRITLSMAN